MGYNVIEVTLDNKPKYLTFSNVYLGVLFSKTTADLSRVRISVNGGASVPVNELLPITVRVAQVILNWDDTETGKQIAFIASDEFVPLGAVSGANTNILLNQIWESVKGMFNAPPLVNDLVVVGTVNFGGNMFAAYNQVTVFGNLLVTDEALLRSWGGVVADGGKVIVEDNAKILSEVIE